MMAGLTREELEERCARLLSDGQQVTSRIEQLLQSASASDPGGFDRSLDGLRREQEEIHLRLEQAMAQLQALDESQG